MSEHQHRWTPAAHTFSSSGPILYTRFRCRCGAVQTWSGAFIRASEWKWKWLTDVGMCREFKRFCA